jgi:hypothetical protein
VIGTYAQRIAEIGGRLILARAQPAVLVRLDRTGMTATIGAGRAWLDRQVAPA